MYSIPVIVIHLDNKWFTFSIPNYIYNLSWLSLKERQEIIFFFIISIIRISHLNFYVRQIKIFEIILKTPTNE